MIKDLPALQDYTHKLAKKWPSLRDSKILKSPGCSEKDCEKLRTALPSLPESYIRCIRQLDLRGISYCGFRFWPGGAAPRNLAERLIVANTSDQNPLLPFFHDNGFYDVARTESNPICVARSGPRRPGGEVLWIIASEPGLKIKPLADDFETFLLLVGNLDFVRDQYDEIDCGMPAFEAFMAILPYFRLSQSAAATWQLIADELYVD